MIVKYSNVFNLTSICSRVEENPLDVRSSILRSEIFIPVYGAGMERKNKFLRRIGAGWGRKQEMYPPPSHIPYFGTISKQSILGEIILHMTRGVKN